MYGVVSTSTYDDDGIEEHRRIIRRWWKESKERWVDDPVDKGDFSDLVKADQFCHNQRRLNQKLCIRNQTFQIYNEGDPLLERTNTEVTFPDGRWGVVQMNKNDPKKVVAIFSGSGDFTIKEAQDYLENTWKAEEKLQNIKPKIRSGYTTNADWITSGSPTFITTVPTT